MHNLSNSRNWLKKHPVTGFYTLAFGISWIGMISAALGSQGIAPFDSPYVQLLSIFYVVGPALAAVIAACTVDGKTGVQNLLKGLTQWRVGSVWYIVALLGSLALFIAVQGLTKLLGFSAKVVTPQVDLSPYFLLVSWSISSPISARKLGVVVSHCHDYRNDIMPS